MSARKITLPVKIGIVMAFLYNIWPLGYLFNPNAAKFGLASNLGAFGQPYNWFFIGGDIICGLLCLIIIWIYIARAVQLHMQTITALLGLGVFGIFTAVSAALPLDCSKGFASCGYNPGQPLGVHDVTGAIAAFGIFVGMGAVWAATSNEHTLHRWNSWILAIWTAWGILFVLTPLMLVQRIPHIQLIASIWEQIFLILSGVGIILIIYSLDPETELKLHNKHGQYV